jgi:hypothetical protein
MRWATEAVGISRAKHERSTVRKLKASPPPPRTADQGPGWCLANALVGHQDLTGLAVTGIIWGRPSTLDPVLSDRGGPDGE